MTLPKQFEWLYQETGPRILTEALKDYGLKEKPGKGNNPQIIKWAKDLGITWYTADGVPWCGLAMGAWAAQAGYPFHKNLLLQATAWQKWGTKIDKEQAMLADVLTFERPGGGHVGLYIGEEENHYCIYGGNQNDAIGFTWIAKDRFHSASRSPFKISQPVNIRKVYLNKPGSLPASLA